MGTLLDSLTSLATPAVGQIAARLGETDAAVSRGIPASLASILEGLVTKTRDPSAVRKVYDLVSAGPSSANLTGDLQTMIGGLGAGVPTNGAAGALLGTLFGKQTNSVGDLIARTAGFRNPSSGSSLLALTAPLALGFLGKKVRDDKMGMGGLSALLAGERDSVLAAAPPGIMNLVGAGDVAPVNAGAPSHGPLSARKHTVEMPRVSGGRGWFWPFVGVAVIALAAWFLVSRGRAPAVGPTTGTTTIDSAASRAGGAVQAAAGEVSGAVGGLGAIVKRLLPNGVELNVPENGIESKLIAFIEDRSRPVNDTTWFDFDRLSFASGSATVLPESREQLNDIVAVLKAYPNVHVKIGGYTDDVGSAAANLRLSQRRADAVRQALIGSGVPANRLQAEGYGEQHPVADNATEEGRARNRRIALRVTQK